MTRGPKVACKPCKMGSRGATVLSCINRKSLWQTNPIIFLKTRYQENIIASTCFRKLISGALRWGALKTSNVTSISFPTWSWVDSIKINFLRLSAVLRVRLETLAPQAFQSAYSSNKGEGSSSSFIVGIFSVINLHYFDTGLGSWGQTISSFSWTLSTTSVHFRSERSTS